MKRSVQYASMLATLLAGSLAHASWNDLPNYNAYYDAPEVTGPLKDSAVPREFVAGVGGIDEKRGVPTVFWATDDGVVAPGGFMARPEGAAQFYLEHYAPLYGLSQSALDASYVKVVHEMPGGGIIVVFEQKANGIELHHTALKIVMTSALELVAITGNLHSAAAQTAKRVHPFRLTEADAIARSFNDFFMTKVPASAFANNNDPQHGYSFFSMHETAETAARNIGLARPARIKQVYFPMPDQLVPAYYVELSASNGTPTSVLYSYVIAADDGRMLERTSLTSDAAFNYKVWNDGSPTFTPPAGPQAKFTPHPTGTANGTYPAFVNQSTITVDGLNTNPGGTFDPWLPAGATESNGNNVDAYVDLAAPDGLSGTDFRANTSSAGNFSYTYNPAQDPAVNANQRKAVITQMFVDINYYHDYWYDSGFNEVSANAQANNYGRGGAGSDPILGEGQDYSGTDNANMQTPADGASPRMQMYIFTAPGSQANPTIKRDGGIDNSIVGHEWGHYLHMRLSSGGSTQYGAMSEGWGDFQAMMQLVRAGDNLAGTYAMSIYAAAEFGDSGYYGIRRYPYSKTFSKNGLTFKHISNGQALPAGGLNFGTNSEVHNAGEIWCSMLWEAFTNVIAEAPSFDQAKRRMANFVVGGLKAAPYDPSFTEQRDGILAAATANGTAADLTALQTGFATRGIGPCAVSPAKTSTTLTGVVEDFTANRANAQFVSLTLTEGTPSCDNDGIVDVGEGGLVNVTIKNVGWAALTGATVTVTSSNGNVQFPGGNSIAIPSTATLGSTTVTIPITLGAGITAATYIPFTAVINAPGTCTTTINGSGAGEVMYDVTVPNSANGVTTETFEGAKTWTAKLNGGATTNLWSVVHPSVPAPVGLNEVAWGQDIGGVSDHTLESPDLAVGTGNFSMTFNHRYDFERSTAPTTYWDGGVIEYSQDGGMTWADVNTIAGVNPGYNATIDNQGSNPLGGRTGYGGQSTNFTTGNMLTRTLAFGTNLANKTIRIRFRIGTDEAAGAGGWFVDNIAFTGLTNKPFSQQVPHNCVAGSCGNGVIDSGEACDDGNTSNGDCCSSACQFESAATVCRAAAGACDVAETCTGSSAMCPADGKAANGTTCSDSNACTTGDTCQAGACVAGTPTTCVASDQCHVAGTCDPMTGMCSNPNAANGTACNDNSACTSGDTCQAGACVGGMTVTCVAMDQCHVAGTCNPMNGMCDNPIAANGTVCNDGSACTQTDACQAGACVGTNPVTCAASDQCHVAGACDPMTGMCSNPAAMDGTACNDGSACTQTDACMAGACVGGNPVNCMPSDQCHTAGMCDPMTGMCTNPTASDGTTCNDGNLCTTMDSCSGGACAGIPVTCTGDECHDAGNCNATTGLCDNPNKPDGTTCGADGTCQAGKCTTGTGGAGGMGGAGGSGGMAGAGGMGGSAGAGGMGGTGGSAGAGGKGGSAGMGEVGGGAGSGGGPVITEGGCGCTIPGDDTPSREMAGSLFALIGAWIVRRRRNSKAS